MMSIYKERFRSCTLVDVCVCVRVCVCKRRALGRPVNVSGEATFYV